MYMYYAHVHSISPPKPSLEHKSRVCTIINMRLIDETFMGDIGMIVSVASVSYRLIVGRKAVSDGSKEVLGATCVVRIN